MFEVFLNAAKFVVSEDARKSTSALIDLIRRSPEWRQDICMLEASITRPYFEQTVLLSDITVSKLENLEFDNEACTAFRTIYLELIRNAFEHGCKSDKEAVRIVIEITKSFVGLSITNPKRRAFYLDQVVENKIIALFKNPFATRGRGLILVKELADSLTMIEEDSGIKAVVYSDRIAITSHIFEELTIITLVKGLKNPSLAQRLMKEGSRYSQGDIIFDLSDFDVDTLVGGSIIQQKLKRSGQQQIIVLHGETPVTLPEAMTADSWIDALEKLDRLALLPKISETYDIGGDWAIVSTNSRNAVLLFENLTIGEGEHVDIQISGNLPVGIHARIRLSRDSWYIQQDPRSTIAIRINGQPVRAARLNNGDHILFHETNFTFNCA